VQTGGEVQSEDLAELAKDVGMEDLPSGGAQHVVARVDAASRATAGADVELSLECNELKLFDPDGGRSLTYEHGNGAGARAAQAAS
jgi:multiple sugar transport system ATP-binding protein